MVELTRPFRAPLGTVQARPHPHLLPSGLPTAAKNMLSALPAPRNLAVSSRPGPRTGYGAIARQLQRVHALVPPCVRPCHGQQGTRVKVASAVRCVSAAGRREPLATSGRRWPTSPIADVCDRTKTRLAAVAAQPKPTFDKEEGGYTKAFVLVRLTVFLRCVADDLAKRTPLQSCLL